MTYLIEYSYDRKGRTTRSKMRVKNCEGEFHAKIRLQDYISRRYEESTNFVVHSCLEESEFSVEHLMNIFNMKA
jgi:hypothetical protein